MRKEELSTLLKTLDIPVNEGITSAENTNKYPRIVYWPFAEQDEMSSGGEYNNIVTYQISFYAKIPQHEKYKELRQALRDVGLHPLFNHEYVENDPMYANTWHTYCAVDVIEDV